MNLSICLCVSIMALAALTVTTTSADSFDFVVVGGGAAGCVVAGRLSETYSVLLLEAGGEASPELDIPATMNTFFNNREYVKVYKTVPQDNTGFQSDGVFSFMTGNTLGGGSGVNIQMYNRGSPHDYDNWANITGDSSWSYGEILKYFRMIEDYQGEFPSEMEHGSGGSITISQPKYAPGLNTWLEAGKVLGYQVGDPNGPQKIGFAPVEFNRKRGRRVSSYQSYLKPLITKGSENLKIITMASVERILFQGTRAIGVKYFMRNGTNAIAYASKEVILSAGVINTPAILLRSGVGPEQVLVASQITPVKLIPVGQNLQDHVHVQLHFLLRREFVETVEPEKDLTPEAWKVFEETGDGPYSNFMGMGGQAFLVSSVRQAEAFPNGDWADIHLLLVQTPSNFEVEGLREMKEKGGQDEEVSVSVVVMITRVKSRGMVSLNPDDVFGDPLVNFEYFIHPDDSAAMIDAVKQTIRIFEAAEPYKKQGARYAPNPIPACKHLPFRSDEYWKCYIDHMMAPAVHAGGTCRMGNSSDLDAVVDSRMKVIGLEGLRVVDASIMPVVTNANTAAPSFVIGEKGVDEILKTWNSITKSSGDGLHQEL